jgi:hypothetical protein
MTKSAIYENLSPAQLAELRDTADLPIRLYSKVCDQSTAKTYLDVKAGHLSAWKDGALTRIAETPRADMKRARKPFVGGVNPVKRRQSQEQPQA